MCECPALYSEKFVHARKAAKCCECGTPIAAGDRYQRSEGLWDGAFSTYKTCAPCAELRDAMMKAASAQDCCEGPAFGDLMNWATEAEVYEPSDTALIEFSARRAASYAAWKAARAVTERGTVE